MERFRCPKCGKREVHALHTRIVHEKKTTPIGQTVKIPIEKCMAGACDDCGLVSVIAKLPGSQTRA